MGLFDALRMMLGGKKPADPAATTITPANSDMPSSPDATTAAPSATPATPTSNPAAPETPAAGTSENSEPKA